MKSYITPKRTVLAAAIGIAALAGAVALAQPTGYGPVPGYSPAAQSANTNVDRVQARIDRMAWRLNLTDEQKAKLKPIFEERQALRIAQRKAMRDKLAQVLTPEQLTQWEQMRGPKGGRRFGGGPCRGGKQGFGPGRGYGYGPGMGPGPGVVPAN
jgi:Spy/CpxP family protein refolding chaperone